MGNTDGVGRTDPQPPRPAAFLLASLALLAHDLTAVVPGLEEQPDAAADLLRLLPRLALGLPLAAFLWASLGGALATRLGGRHGGTAWQRWMDVYLSAPLLVLMVPLFSGAAIRESSLRWPALVLGWAGTLGLVSTARWALRGLERSRAKAQLVWLAPLAALILLVAAGALTRNVLRGLYPAFHGAITLGTLIGVALLLDAGLAVQARRQARATSVPLWLGALALVWPLSGALALPASAGRLTLLELADFTGALVSPMYRLDRRLGHPFESPQGLADRRLMHFEALKPAGHARRSVLLITVDALRWDSLDPDSELGHCMPGLQALTGQSLTYERAYAPSNETALTVTTLLSGRTSLASSDQWSPRELLPEAFSRHGWETYAWFTGHNMPPIRSDLPALRGRGFGFQAYRGDYRDAAEVLSWAQEVVGAGPAFVWVHLSDVHEPLHLTYRGGPAPAGCAGEYLKRHAWLDAQLAASLTRISAAHPSVIWALTADHGESRGERGVHGHGSNLHDEQVRVPLLVHGPGLTGQGSSQVVSLAKLGPVLLSLASSDTPASAEDLGWSFQPDGAVPLLSRRACGLVRGNHKLIMNAGAGTVALYDLLRDPAELRNRAPSHGTLTGELLERLDAFGCPAGSMELATGSD